MLIIQVNIKLLRPNQSRSTAPGVSTYVVMKPAGRYCNLIEKCLVSSAWTLLLCDSTHPLIALILLPLRYKFAHVWWQRKNSRQCCLRIERRQIEYQKDQDRSWKELRLRLCSPIRSNVPCVARSTFKHCIHRECHNDHLHRCLYCWRKCCRGARRATCSQATERAARIRKTTAKSLRQTFKRICEKHIKQIYQNFK